MAPCLVPQKARVRVTKVVTKVAVVEFGKIRCTFSGARWGTDGHAVDYPGTDFIPGGRSLVAIHEVREDLRESPQVTRAGMKSFLDNPQACPSVPQRHRLNVHLIFRIHHRDLVTTL